MCKEEKIVIKDKKRNPQMVIYPDHPYYNEIKNNIMPDEYRAKMKEISNICISVIEEDIREYYEQIENPYDEVLKDVVNPFMPLIIVGLITN